MLELDQEEEERRESVNVIESPREKVQIIQQVKKFLKYSVSILVS